MVEYAYITMPGELGELVREVRKDQGLSQVELASKSGCSQRLVSEFERGKGSVELGKAMALLRALGLSIGVSGARTPQQSREVVRDAVNRIAGESLGEPMRHRKLTDYLEAEHG